MRNTSPHEFHGQELADKWLGLEGMDLCWLVINKTIGVRAGFPWRYWRYWSYSNQPVDISRLWLIQLIDYWNSKYIYSISIVIPNYCRYICYSNNGEPTVSRPQGLQQPSVLDELKRCGFDGRYDSWRRHHEIPQEIGIQTITKPNSCGGGI